MASILIVDDDADILEIQQQILEESGHKVERAAEGGEALRLAQQHSFDLVITDLFMPGKEGMETIVALRKAQHPLKILAVSGGGSRALPGDHLEMARRVGADATLTKPYSAQELLAAVASLLT